MFEWRVIRIKSAPAHVVGYFTAVNAIKQAIEQHEISDPLAQARLAAQKVREIS